MNTMNVSPLHWIDWIVIALQLLVTVSVGVAFARRGGKDVTSYFLSGRNLIWPVAGISMLATSFASDTPLWVSGLVRQFGVSVGWQFWSGFIGASLGAVCIARWWRRAGVLTDVELIELRYSGKPAALLRGWNGFFGAVVMTPLIIAWVTKGMEMTVREALALPPEAGQVVIFSVLVLALLTCFFSGLDGVIYSDLILFFTMLTGSVALGWFSVQAAGGLAVVSAVSPEGAGSAFTGMIPSIGWTAGKISPWNMVAYFGILWLFGASGSGATVQRAMSCRDTRHAGLAMGMFALILFALLSWPWIMTALSSLVLMPQLPDGLTHEGAYLRMARTVLPVGVQGLFFAAFAAAFISTVNSILNVGSSYVVNDIYRRFLVRNAGMKHYVTIGRLATLILAAAGGIVATRADSIQQLLQISFIVGGAIGPMVLLRWLWPRLTALGELSAVTCGWAVAFFFIFGPADAVLGPLFGVPDGASLTRDYSYMGARMLFSTGLAVSSAVLVSLLGPKTDREHLRRFAQSCALPAVLWGRYEEPGVACTSPEQPLRTLISWGLLGGSIFCVLLGMRNLLLGSKAGGAVALSAAVVGLVILSRRLKVDAGREPRAKSLED
jgi:SSS family solute:Na+ symporter